MSYIIRAMLCPICNDEFEPKRSDAKVCSKDACRKKYQRAKGKTLEEVLPANDYDYEANLKAFQAMGIEPTEWLSTNTGLDELTQLPVGRIIEVFGPEGVGKTTLALNLIKGISDKKILYLDTEGTMDPERMARLELNAQNVHLKKMEYIEDIYDSILENYQAYDLIVVDSVANCSFRTEFEGESADANIGVKARILNKLMRILPHKLRDNKCTLLLINQERQSIGGYMQTIYTPGGNGIKYAASMRIRLTTTLGDRFPKGGPFKGQEVTAEIKKSKVSPPYKKGKFKLYYV